MDIVVEESNVRNGFLAERDKEYAAMISYILNLNPEGRQGIRERARSSVDRFSDRHFDIGKPKFNFKITPLEGDHLK